MNFDDYKKWAVTTRVDTYLPIVSPVLSLVEEFGEIYHEMQDGDFSLDSFELELGDFLWYIVNLAHDLKVELELPVGSTTFMSAFGYLTTLCGQTKRYIRDGSFKIPNLHILVGYVLSLTSDFEMCMQLNYEKLTKRQVNGTIKDINRG